ncbi:MAG: hypothetical protein CENE_01023 [Candidatus Celerinatantimonas neptuna]|nr:MAG: hypothetical protein CENE_01023 [Candidatus Celerinatantimonas neptuna]
MNKSDNSYLFQPEFIIPRYVNTILCFGDSNTWGFAPDSSDPIPRPWPVILQYYLNQYQIISDGQCGRTINHSSPELGLISGYDTLEHYKKEGKLLLIMLGSNDLCCHFNLSSEAITQSLHKLIMYWPPGQLVIIAPAPMTLLSKRWALYFKGREEDSMQLAHDYQNLAQKLGCGFFNAGDVATPETDGLHLGTRGHELLAKALADNLIPEITPPRSFI